MAKDKRLEEIRKRYKQRVVVYGEPESESPLGDTGCLLLLLEAEVRRRQAAEAVIESGYAIQYQAAIAAWRQLVKEAGDE